MKELQGFGPRFIDITGRRFTRLVVVEFSRRHPEDGRLLWNCVCDCGAVVEVVGVRLHKGNARSCGCLWLEHQSIRARKHGMNKSPEHRSWVAMRQRCFNPKDTSYPYYGERGITVCDRWRSDFVAFFEDMGKKPFPEATIDRKDPDGNYEPGNCQWASRAEQSQNQRRFKVVEVAE